MARERVFQMVGVAAAKLRVFSIRGKLQFCCPKTCLVTVNRSERYSNCVPFHQTTLHRSAFSAPLPIAHTDFSAVRQRSCFIIHFLKPCPHWRL